MVNSREVIPLCESMVATRHSSVEKNLEYTALDNEAHTKQYHAMALKTSIDKGSAVEEIMEMDKPDGMLYR